MATQPTNQQLMDELKVIESLLADLKARMIADTAWNRVQVASINKGPK